MLSKTTLALALCAATMAAASPPDGTAAGGTKAEWGGLFHLEDLDPAQTELNWIFQKTGVDADHFGEGDYVDDFIVMSFHDIAGGDDAAFEAAAEGPGKVAFDKAASACTAVAPGATITPSATDCFKITFDADDYETKIKINTAGVDFLAVFGQHFPIEFEQTIHYLITNMGDAVEPAHEMPESHDDHDDEEVAKPYGTVILATFLVNLATLSGVAFLALKCVPASMGPTFQGSLMGFAAGALMGCAFYLILIESSHFVMSFWPTDEATSTAYWATATLAGYLTPLFFFLLEPGKCGSVGSAVEDGKDAESNEAITIKKNTKNTTVIAICLGDFAHNLTDGFLIGVGFKFCPGSMAWTIMLATLYHEIAQELADFIILTSSDVGATVLQALTINFLAGTSVIIGGVITVALDINNGTLGLILAYGGGTYVYLAASEALPRALALSAKIDAVNFGKIKKHYALVILWFIIGVTAVALILLNHKHCSANHGDEEEASDDPHAGHNHLRRLAARGGMRF